MSKLKAKKGGDTAILDQKSRDSYANAQDTIKTLKKNGFQTEAKILTTVLAKNPYNVNTPQYIMWNEQTGINIPFLFLACLSLYEFAKKVEAKHLLFVTRDCVHWHRIWKALFPNEEFTVTFFDSSRIMFQEAEKTKNKYYMQYINKVTEGDISKAIYIDIHATGRHLLSFCNKRLNSKTPACFFLTVGAKNYKDMHKEVYQQIFQKGRYRACSFDMAGSCAEMLNYHDSMGSLVNYDANGPVRMKLEYDGKTLRPYFKCVNYYLKLHERTESHSINTAHADECMKHIAKRIRKRKNQPVINTWITHVRKHEEDAKKFNKNSLQKVEITKDTSRYAIQQKASRIKIGKKQRRGQKPN